MIIFFIVLVMLLDCVCRPRFFGFPYYYRRPIYGPMMHRHHRPMPHMHGPMHGHMCGPRPMGGRR